MPPNDRDKLNRIEELKTKLFSKNYQTKIEHRDDFTHLEKRDVRDAWEDQAKFEADPSFSPRKFFMKTSVFKNFFIFSIAFFLLAIGYAAYVFLAGGNTVSNDNIDISILGNNFTAGGEELPFIVGIANKNSSPLDLVDLVMEYPKNSSVLPTDTSSPSERSRISLGTIPAGVVHNENLKVVLFGEQGSVVPIKISIEYRVEGSNAIFVKSKEFDVTISSTPLNLSFDAPDAISPNENIVMNIKATLNATRPSSSLLLKADYPVGFQFISSTPAPTLGNNIWSLGNLAPGADSNISITGKMIGVSNGEEKTFHITSGSQSSTDKSVIDVVLNSVSHTIAIKKPFIEGTLFINGASGGQYATDTRTPIQAEIKWVNNLDTKVEDLSILVKISGNAFDPQTVNAQQGFYDSNQNTITWDKNSKNEFSEINPNDSGSVVFSVAPLSSFSGAGGILSDPSINIEVSISGKQSVSGYATQDLNNSDTGVVHIISDVGFAVKALYYSGPFKNTGPIPPKVGKQSSYTIVWSLSNTANNISNAVVHSTIPSWVNFAGPISPPQEDLTYNPSTREIVWNIGRISKGTGIITANRSVSFQVALTPSLSQVGTSPTIINQAVLTGHDDFANVDVKVNKTSLSTVLINDSQFPAGGGAVTE